MVHSMASEQSKVKIFIYREDRQRLKVIAARLGELSLPDAFAVVMASYLEWDALGDMELPLPDVSAEGGEDLGR